ncbi:alpha/beta hydrolase [Winogradskya consettensis]|uniref:Peptidase n=1 Tax=Winogradskya consettensis TaxID=113560 RepID=A0A919SY06_9ACTN|nr:alpha/beta hydrolase [Actinoplanes consettensis]GIM79476.1 peptidase [Actinoplanes consettensis]
MLIAVSAAVPTSASAAGAGSTAAKAQQADTTSALERKRVDSVPTPKLDWYECWETAECATTRLPLDYDQPTGAKTEIAVLRIKAKDQAHKIGTLFVNPGGPGGSATSFAYSAQYFLSESVLERFDIVGFDPRGIDASQNLHCFPSVKEQTAVLAQMNVAFPWGKAQEDRFIAAAKKFGKACSTTGNWLAGSMSSAEAARDMDVLRRAVGDQKLSFLGFSYGSVIGQFYANMFPDRFRALTVDGVLDPEHWVGTPATAGQEQDARLRSGNGAYRALMEILHRCDAVGEEFCVFAAGDPVKNFETIAQTLRKKPLVLKDEWGTWTITYADFVSGILGSMYGIDAGDWATYLMMDLWNMLFPPTQEAAAEAKAALLDRIKEARGKPARDFYYSNGFEAFAGVDCTDALHPQDAANWPALMAKADKQAPYFGRAWGWDAVQCARNTWTVRDEDAYTGPWTAKTAAPVLFVGAKWDPATNYDDAVSASKRLPNSRLLSNTNWGHTSYGTSDCATDAIDTYLLTGALPAKGTWCDGDYQPFTTPVVSEDEQETMTLSEARKEQGLPDASRRAPYSIFNSRS